MKKDKKDINILGLIRIFELALSIVVFFMFFLHFLKSCPFNDFSQFSGSSNFHKVYNNILQIGLILRETFAISNIAFFLIIGFVIFAVVIFPLLYSVEKKEDSLFDPYSSDSHKKFVSYEKINSQDTYAIQQRFLC